MALTVERIVIDMVAFSLWVSKSKYFPMKKSNSITWFWSPAHGVKAAFHFQCAPFKMPKARKVFIIDKSDLALRQGYGLQSASVLRGVWPARARADLEARREDGFDDVGWQAIRIL